MGEQTVWIVVKNRELVGWKSESDGEEGLEVHRTKALAEAAKFKGEKVVPARLIWE